MYASAEESIAYYLDKYISDCITIAKKFKKVYLYGAGQIGSKVYQALVKQKINIGGFLVTAKKGNPESMFGIPIIPISDFYPEEKSYTVIISTPIGYRWDIERILDERNIPHCYYRGD